MQRCCLVVGGSSGIGLRLTIEALEAGHRVFATSREPAKAKDANPEVENLGGEWLKLDIVKDDAEDTVRKVVEENGIDIVVISAGYALLGPVEDIRPSELQDQLNTNFIGPWRVIRGILPVFRARRGGMIINISSGAALIGKPSRGAYAASKAALEAMSEALSAEVESFNIRVLIVELGAFSTHFAKNLVLPKTPLTSDYKDTVTGKTLAMTKALGTMALGDPNIAAQRILEMATGRGMAGSAAVQDCQRLIIGSDCMTVAQSKIKSLSADCVAMQDIAKSTDPRV